MLFCSLPWHMTCALPGRAFTPFFSMHCSFGHQGSISFMMPSLTSLHMSSEFLAWFWIYAESLNTSVIATILYYNGMFTSRPFLFIWAPLRQSCHLKYVSLVPSVQYLLNEKYPVLKKLMATISHFLFHSFLSTVKAKLFSCSGGSHSVGTRQMSVH